MKDIELRQDVLDELEFDPRFDAAHIGVAAEAGIVTLTGYVGSYAERLAALYATRRVKGVLAIADDMEVRHPGDREANDDEIAKRAKAILEWDTSLPQGTIKVTVRNAFVWLAGSVQWFYQKKAAEKGVRKLSGVIGVFNNIEIAPIVTAADVKQKIEDAFKRHAAIEAEAIRVSVRNTDEVILEGEVAHLEERYAAENAAWSAPGVKSVEDKITIR